MRRGLQEVAVAGRALRVQLEILHAPVLQNDELDVLAAHVADDVGVGIEVQRRLGVRHGFDHGRVGVQHVLQDVLGVAGGADAQNLRAWRPALRPAARRFANMSMRVFDGIALGELVALHQDVLVLIEQHGLGGSGAAVDAHEAFDHLAGLELRGDELLGLVALP